MYRWIRYGLLGLQAIVVPNEMSFGGVLDVFVGVPPSHSVSSRQRYIILYIIAILLRSDIALIIFPWAKAKEAVSEVESRRARVNLNPSGRV